MSLSHFNNTLNSWDFFNQILHIKFYDNPFRGSRVVALLQKDKQTGGRGYGGQVEKTIVIYAPQGYKSP